MSSLIINLTFFSHLLPELIGAVSPVLISSPFTLTSRRFRAMVSLRAMVFLTWINTNLENIKLIDLD